LQVLEIGRLSHTATAETYHRLPTLGKDWNVTRHIHFARDAFRQFISHHLEQIVHRIDYGETLRAFVQSGQRPLKSRSILEHNDHGNVLAAGSRRQYLDLTSMLLCPGMLNPIHICWNVSARRSVKEIVRRGITKNLFSQTRYHGQIRWQSRGASCGNLCKRWRRIMLVGLIVHCCV